MNNSSLLPFVFILALFLAVAALSFAAAWRMSHIDQTASNISWVSFGIAILASIIAIFGIFYWSKPDCYNNITSTRTPFIVLLLLALIIHIFSLITAYRAQGIDTSSSVLSWISVGLTAIIVLISLLAAIFWSNCYTICTNDKYILDDTLDASLDNTGDDLPFV